MTAASPVATPAALTTAQALLQGQLSLADSLGISITYDRESLPDWLEWMFEPERIIADLSRADARPLLAYKAVTGVAEEKAAREETLDALGLEVAARIYAAACENTMRELIKLAETAQGQVCPRLHARLCAACRDELAELVREFRALMKEVA